MNLEKWANDLAVKLRSDEDVVISKNDVRYRGLLASILLTQLTGSGAPIIDGLLSEAFGLSQECNLARKKIEELQKIPEEKKGDKNAIKKG